MVNVSEGNINTPENFLGINDDVHFLRENVLEELTKFLPNVIDFNA